MHSIFRWPTSTTINVFKDLILNLPNLSFALTDSAGRKFIYFSAKTSYIIPLISASWNKNSSNNKSVNNK